MCMHPEQVKLLGPAALIFERVVVRDFRATPLSQSPGFDLVATSDRNVGALVLLKDSILMLRKYSTALMGDWETVRTWQVNLRPSLGNAPQYYNFY